MSGTRRRLDCHPLRLRVEAVITQPTAPFLLGYGTITPTSTVVFTAEPVVGAPDQVILILIPVLLPQGIL